MFSVKRQIKVWVAIAFTLVTVGELGGQGFLIPAVRTGMVFDHAGQNLTSRTGTD